MPQELKRSLVKEQGPMTIKKLDKFVDGPHNIKRRNVLSRSSNKTDDGRNIVGR